MRRLMRMRPEQQKDAVAPYLQGQAHKTARKRAPISYCNHFLRLGERAFVRHSIYKALALRALNDLCGTHRIVHAELDTIRVAEIEFSKIAVQCFSPQC